MMRNITKETVPTQDYLVEEWSENTSDYNGVSFVAPVYHKRENGFVIGVLDASVNSHLMDSEMINAKSIVKFKELIANYIPRKAAHLWAEEFYTRGVPFHHRNPLLAAAFVEADTTTGTAEFHRAADAQIWMKSKDVWSNVFPEHMLTTKGMRVLATVKRKTPKDWWTWQEENLDDLSLWRYPLIGLTPHPVFVVKRFKLEDIQEIVVATSSALITKENVETLDNWLDVSIKEVDNLPKRYSSNNIAAVRLSF